MPFALVDCNNFYVSCERVFEPKLEDCPVIVLSNNDGCAIARSEEVKTLGVKMGEPAFKLRGIIEKHSIRVFSSNYALYGDMSRRVNACLEQFSPAAEVYSIDETFLDLAGFGRRDLWSYGQDLRSTVKRWTGIPTCVGIGPTKTLAKLANAAAKKNPVFGGACDLSEPAVRDAVLRAFPIGGVWGVGPATARKLVDLGVSTAAGLRDSPPKLAREVGTVTLERLVLELNGVPCAGLEPNDPARRGLAVTRSFGRPVTGLGELVEALAAHAARAGEKLRRGGLVAGQLTAFFHTNPHKPDAPRHAGARTASLAPMTDDARDLVAAARRCAEAAFKPGYAYTKAGVILDDLRPAGLAPRGLFDTPRDPALMRALDAINAKHGRHALRPASVGYQKAWRLRAERKSPAYTTNLSDLPRVRA